MPDPTSISTPTRRRLLTGAVLGGAVLAAEDLLANSASPTAARPLRWPASSQPTENSLPPTEARSGPGGTAILGLPS